jgi:hypothetical protein
MLDCNMAALLPAEMKIFLEDGKRDKNRNDWTAFEHAPRGKIFTLDFHKSGSQWTPTSYRKCCPYPA